MTTIKAIETQYKGYRFRSRLEARWAVFFDALGVKWEYEPEGFDLGKLGWYLPDFWLPAFETYIEIKPDGANDNEKAWAFSGYDFDNDAMLGRPILYIEGAPGDYIAHDYRDSVGEADEGKFTACPECGTPDFVYGGWIGYIGCKCGVPRELFKTGPDSVGKVQTAIMAARSARFEHGERPRMRA